MTADLATLRTPVCVLIDDHVVPSGQRCAGRPKKLACRAVAQVVLGALPEYHRLRLCYARLGRLRALPARAARLPQAPQGCGAAQFSYYGALTVHQPTTPAMARSEWIRHWIESVSDPERLGWQHPAGAWARIAQRLLATAVWRLCRRNRVQRSLIDHWTHEEPIIEERQGALAWVTRETMTRVSLDGVIPSG